MRVLPERQLAIVLGALSGTPRVVAGGNFATPWRALAVLDGALARYRLFALNAQPGIPDREGVTLESPFVGPGMRGRSRLGYFPCRLSLVPALLASALPPDVVLVQTSVPSNGTVSLGTEVNMLPAAIEAVKARGGLVIAQLNPRAPYTYGDSEVSCDVIDYAIEAEAPLPSPPERPMTESSAIMPTGWPRLSATAPRCSWVSVRSPTPCWPGCTVGGDWRCGRRCSATACSVSLRRVRLTRRAGHRVVRVRGADLYNWMDRNPGVRMLRTETTNDPGRIARRPRMTSINSALQVDLFAQANATWVNGTRLLGLRRADGLRGRRAALARAARRSSRCRPGTPRRTCRRRARLDGPVTTFQHSYIISEQGAAAVWGHDASGQAEQIIGGVAHPSVRQELREAGRHLRLRLLQPLPRWGAERPVPASSRSRRWRGLVSPSTTSPGGPTLCPIR